MSPFLLDRRWLKSLYLGVLIQTYVLIGYAFSDYSAFCVWAVLFILTLDFDICFKVVPPTYKDSIKLPLKLNF